MTAMLLVVSGSAMIGLTVAYLMWIDLRVIEFREDLFQVRDEMWDRMRERGELDLEDHKIARKAINSLIRFAPRLSLLTVIHAYVSDHASDEMPRPIEDSQVARYLDLVYLRLGEYILRQGLSRPIIIMLSWMLATARIVSPSAAKERVKSVAKDFVMSDEMLHDQYCAQ